MTAAGKPIAVAGAGRAARALGRLLHQAGEPVIAVASRDINHARDAAQYIGPDVDGVAYSGFPRAAGRVLIAVPDDALTGVAELLSRRTAAGIALHTCGARGPEALSPLAGAGFSCGTLHPLQTITETALPNVLEGVAFAVWGDPAAVAWAEGIAALAGGEVLRIPPELRPFYHAAAVMASNYLTALVDAAQSLMSLAGVDETKALRALAPLARTTVENAVARGPVGALTGPIERGDRATVEAHLKSLAAAPGRIQALYRAAGLQTLDLARRRGLDHCAARELERILSEE